MGRMSRKDCRAARASVSRSCQVCARAAWTAALALAVALAAPPARGAEAPADSDRVVLDTTLGPIVIRLFPADAPRTVANFRRLVAEGFYDGTCFHRAIPGFVVQGGDPNSRNADPADDGLGGPGWTLPAEPGRRHVRGAVAMARRPDLLNPRRESNGSQFYVVLARQPSLDAGGGTVFGEVISGLAVVDAIAALANDPATPQTPQGANPCARARVLGARFAPVPRPRAAGAP